MHEVTQCPVCESPSRHDLVAFGNDPYLKRLPTRTDHTVRYAACAECGFVYQPQMMDEAEMTALYSTSYRPSAPDEAYLNANRAVALEVFSWIAEKTGMHGKGRAVLDIGCATGMFLRPFAQQGWRAVGLDAGGAWIKYGRRTFGLDLRSEFFTGESFPGQQFDLILFSHVIEHVLDPAPVLAAIRRKLSDDGYLFIGTPNVVAPRRKLYPGLFGGDHVRLFSPRTIRAYLARHGFRAVTVETHQPRGLRVLAAKADVSPVSRPHEKDDWRMILAMVRGSLAAGPRLTLERNMAALRDEHTPVVEEVCLRRDPSPYCVGWDGQEADNVGIHEGDGTVRWLYGARGSRERASLTMKGALPDQSCNGLLLRGLGLGHLAEGLDARLDPSCRLHIWEPDVSLFATTIRVRDLSALFRSPRVTLHVGSDVGFFREIVRSCGPIRIRKVDEPTESSMRHPLHAEFEVLLTVGAARPPKQPAGSPVTEKMCAAG